MPVFFFNVRGEGFEIPDLTGRDCAGLDAARDEAERLAAELIETALLSGELPMDATIEVDDEEMRPVLALPLNEAGA